MLCLNLIFRFPRWPLEILWDGDLTLFLTCSSKVVFYSRKDGINEVAMVRKASQNIINSNVVILQNIMPIFSKLIDFGNVDLFMMDQEEIYKCLTRKSAMHASGSCYTISKVDFVILPTFVQDYIHICHTEILDY